jgi:hypothetical protein
VCVCVCVCVQANYAVYVTPARLVTGLVTERGVCKAELDSVLALFPEKKEQRTQDANNVGGKKRKL